VPIWYCKSISGFEKSNMTSATGAVNQGVVVSLAKKDAGNQLTRNLNNLIFFHEKQATETEALTMRRGSPSPHGAFGHGPCRTSPAPSERHTSLLGSLLLKLLAVSKGRGRTRVSPDLLCSALLSCGLLQLDGVRCGSDGSLYTLHTGVALCTGVKAAGFDSTLGLSGPSTCQRNFLVASMPAGKKVQKTVQRSEPPTNRSCR
jgi:hypothetical protein